jgi:GNAT superfamily N-acetyltransferase
VEYALVGWPEEGPRLRLDHREFSYAGKFVMSNTGKAVAREGDTGEDLETSETDGRDWIEDDRIAAAVSFNADRTDPATAWLRYVTVRDDVRGRGVGARLSRFATARLRGRDYGRAKIAVNNPFAYHALYKAGFGYTGDQTGLAELVLARPGDRSPDRYRAGLAAFRDREDLAAEERSFLDSKADADPPDVVSVPE